MRMIRLAFLNFKNSFKNYLSLIVSLAFTILIFLNFQNIIYSDTFAVLGTRNKEYIDIIVRVISFVLGCFMFFFIWYSTNVFLTKRKKEIGIYVFMGLTNKKIGKMYMIETIFIGISALVLGVVFGVLTTGLFQMILSAISDIAVDIEFQFVMRPVLITAGIYLFMYFIFVLKGYFNIVNSSVLEMLSAARQNEYVRQNAAVLLFKAALGIGVLGTGCYLAIKESGSAAIMGNVLAAVILVTAGVYLLFGGLIPLIFQSLAKSKGFLYRRQRTLWVNSLIFRIKKNYRTYAMVSVLILCSVTALATGFAMQNRYENIINFENMYTFQFLSNQADLDEKTRQLIEKHSEIAYSARIDILQLDASVVEAQSYFSNYAVVAYSQLRQLAKDAGLEFTLEEPNADEIIEARHLYLLSLITDRSDITVTINGKTYRQIEETSIPYLGYLQEQIDFYVVNDAEYEAMLPLGEQLHTYHYKIVKPEAFEAARNELDALSGDTEGNNIGRIAVDPNSNEIDWIKVLYSLCIFMFMVFILASGSIMFMKLYNDAFEEKERYLIMRKIGVDNRALRKSAAKELGTAYVMPFLVMGISSYFSVHALEKMMNESLRSIHLLSIFVVLAIFLGCYLLSVSVYRKNVGI